MPQVWAGYRLKLDYSAKLFSLTFLLVTFGAMQSKGGATFLTQPKAGACFPPILPRCDHPTVRNALEAPAAQRLPS